MERMEVLVLLIDVCCGFLACLLIIERKPGLPKPQVVI
jgi:hypothetical protein